MKSLFVTTSKGLESVLVQELKSLGIAAIQKDRGGVRIVSGRDITDAQLMEYAYRICFYSRIAGRVLLELKTIECKTADQLYAGVRSIHWTDHIASNGTLAIDFYGVNQAIKNTQFGALKAKDAICDQLRTLKGERPSVNTKRPDVRISIHLKKNDQATVAIDLSGDSLHMRGFRTESVAAPIKENLAAALLWMSGWVEKSHDGVPLMDVFCGSGTIVLEAAFIALDVAPGLLRFEKPFATASFGFENWLGRDSALIQSIHQEAKDRLQARVEKLRAGRGSGIRTLQRIVGYDVDSNAIRAALRNLESSGIPDLQKNAASIQVHFEKRALGEGPVPSGKPGWLVSNPPYGHRIGADHTARHNEKGPRKPIQEVTIDMAELKALYRSLGDFMKKQCEGWKAGIITEASDLSKSIGLKPKDRIEVWNGPIECRFLTYDLYAGSQTGPKALDS